MEVGYTLIEIVKLVIHPLIGGSHCSTDNDNGIKTDEPHRCPNKPHYVGNKDTSHSTNILPMTESEAEVAAPLDAKGVAEDTVSNEDRIIDMMNRMMIKLDRLLGLLEGKKGNNI